MRYRVWKCHENPSHDLGVKIDAENVVEALRLGRALLDGERGFGSSRFIGYEVESLDQKGESASWTPTT